MWIQHTASPRDLEESEGAPAQVPNYASRMLWAIWSFTVASAVFLGLRVYCKLLRRRPLWWDDHFLIASWVSHRLTPPRLDPDCPEMLLTRRLRISLPSWFRRLCCPKLRGTVSACTGKTWTIQRYLTSTCSRTLPASAPFWAQHGARLRLPSPYCGYLAAGGQGGLSGSSSSRSTLYWVLRLRPCLSRAGQSRRPGIPRLRVPAGHI